MENTVIKNAGNSRSLHFPVTAVTEYPNLAAFLAAGISEAGIPIDIGPMNPEGVVQMGTPLNKQTILTDETAALYGKPSTAVPDDIFAAIKTLINNVNTSISKKVTAGYYTGNGVAERTIPLPFTPKGVLVTLKGYDMYLYSSGNYHFFGGLAVTGASVGATVGSLSSIPASVAVTSNGFIVREDRYSLGSNYYVYQRTNASENQYHFIAVG